MLATLFIVTGDGVVIAHPEGKYNGKSINEFLPNARIADGMNSNVEVAGKENNLRFVKVPDQDWYIGVLLDEKIAYQSVYSMKNNAIIYGIIALIISVVSLLLLTKRLLMPLDDLNEAIKDVASGNGDLTKRLKTNTDKEFAELARGFNTFSGNLQGQVTQLKASGRDILQGTEITEKGAAEVSAAMGTQLQEIELLATAMNEMATTASDVASSAQGAAAAAQEAEGATQVGAGNC